MYFVVFYNFIAIPVYRQWNRCWGNYSNRLQSKQCSKNCCISP